MKSAMSNATIMKYQPFKYYYEKYHKKLNEPNSLV